MLEVRGRLDLGQEPPGSYDRSELRLQHRARDLPLVLDVVGGDGFADAVETQGRLTTLEFCCATTMLPPGREVQAE